MDKTPCIRSGTPGVWTPETIALYAHTSAEMSAHIGDYVCDGCGVTGPGTRMVTQRGMLRSHLPGKLPH